MIKIDHIRARAIDHSVLLFINLMKQILNQVRLKFQIQFELSLAQHSPSLFLTFLGSQNC